MTNQQVQWYDDANPPTEPGIYYMENCDQYGNPRPGLMYWEEGKPWQSPSIPTRYFGPIRGAMQPWETAGTDTPIVVS